MQIAFLSFEAFRSGGIRTYTRELVNGFSRAGHQVVLFSPPKPSGAAPNLSAAVTLQPVPVAEAPFTSAVTYWWNLPFVFRRTERQLGQFDIVHSNAYADAFLTKRSAPATRVVTVYHLGGTAAASAGLHSWSRIFMLSSEYGPAVLAESVCLRRADHVIAISGFTRDDVLRWHPRLKADNVSVIYPGTTEAQPISEEEKTKLMRKWGISRDERIVLSVGRLEHRKGIPFLLESFSRVRSIAMPKLILIGGGPPGMYKAIARRLGIADRVIFAGPVDESTLRTAYDIADVLAHASSMEGFGLSVADAVSMGLPVVAARVGSIPEVVRDGQDGSLVDFGDVPSFARALTTLLDRAATAGPIHRFPKVKIFSWERTVRETLKLYEELVTTRREPSRSG